MNPFNSTENTSSDEINEPVEEKTKTQKQEVDESSLSVEEKMMIEGKQVQQETTKDEIRNPDYNVTLDPRTAEVHMDKELMVNGVEGRGPYAGKWPRLMFETAYDKPKQATWVGYRNDPQEGLREVPISHNNWFRHAAVFGTTGYGKTTFLKNIMIQWAYAGFGFCFIDPKGDGVLDLMKELPENRLDDVIWVEPGAVNRDRVVGLNFLEPGSADTKNEREAEIEGIIEDLINVLKDEGYWGPRMDGILSNLARGMIASEKNYTLIDMYYALLDEQYRQMFVEDVDDPAVREYTEVIAEEMEQSDLDALIRRLQKFVENRLTREIIAHRESSFNIKDAVEDGKIILVKNDVDSSDAQQMISTGVMRRIWAAIKSRSAIEKHKRTPYFLIVDEFDDIANEDADIDKMLSKARSFRLSVTLCNQQPSQLPKKIRKSIFGNCDNLLAFNPNEPQDASLIMKRFGEFTANDLTQLGRFKMFTRVMVGDEQSPPFTFNTFADYPPLRGERESQEAIRKSLEQYGGPRPDPVEAVNDLVLDTDEYDPGESGQKLKAEVESKDGESEEIELTERDVLETLFALETKGEYETKPPQIPTEDIEEELEKRTGEEIYQSIIAQIIEQMASGELIDVHETEGGFNVSMTGEGRKFLLTFDTGKAATGGGFGHRHLLKKTFKTFTEAGYSVKLITQEGDEDADGLAISPVNPYKNIQGKQDYEQRMKKLKQEFPDVDYISGGEDVNIESETTTPEKPKQVLRNLRKSIQSGNTCIFAVKDMEDEKGTMEYYGRRVSKIITDPPLVNKEYEDGKRVFYNKSSQMEIADKQYAVRPKHKAKRTLWVENENGSISLIDSKSKEVITSFESLDELKNAGKDDVPAFYRKDRSSGSYICYMNTSDGGRTRRAYDEQEFKEDWVPIRPPYIPEWEFETLPSDDDWKVVVFPKENKDLPPLEYKHDNPDGEKLTPLLQSHQEKYGKYIDPENYELKDDNTSISRDEEDDFFEDGLSSVDENTKVNDTNKIEESDFFKDEFSSINETEIEYENLKNEKNKGESKQESDIEIDSLSLDMGDNQFEESSEEESSEDVIIDSDNDIKVVKSGPFDKPHYSLNKKTGAIKSLCGKTIFQIEAEIIHSSNNENEICPKCKRIKEKKYE